MHWISPREATHHMGIVQLLLHFQWRWIGLIVSDDDSGESFLENFIPLLTQHSICIAFLHKDTILNYINDKQYLGNLPKLIQALLLTEVNVIILQGDSRLIICLVLQLDAFEFSSMIYIGKVWIMPPQWYFTADPSGIPIGAQLLQGALSFSFNTKVVPGFWDFLQTCKPDESLMDFLCSFWEKAFRCNLSNINNNQFGKCTGNEKLESLPLSQFEMDMTGQSYAIYNAVYAVAHVLHAIHLSRQKTMLDRGKFKHLNVQPWQVKSAWMHFKLSETVKLKLIQGKLNQIMNSDAERLCGRKLRDLR